MAAHKNNDYAMKFKTPEERKDLCDKWCAWLTVGKSKESFPDCDPQTFRRYCEDFPEDFDTQKIETAERACRAWWEDAGREMMWRGSKDVSPVIWIFSMKNRFKWRDNVDVTSDGKRLDSLNGLFTILDERKDDPTGDASK